MIRWVWRAYFNLVFSLLLQTITFVRASLVFCFNFHPSNSYSSYKVGMDQPGEYRIVLDSDWSEFGGHSRRDKNTTSHTYKEGHVGKRCHMLTYLPSRTAVVFERVGTRFVFDSSFAESTQLGFSQNGVNTAHGSSGSFNVHSNQLKSQRLYNIMTLTQIRLAKNNEF